MLHENFGGAEKFVVGNYRFLQGFYIAVQAADVSFCADLFRLCSRGGGKIRRVARLLFGFAADFALPSFR